MGLAICNLNYLYYYDILHLNMSLLSVKRLFNNEG